MKIVMASAEVAPFARTGGLGDVLGSLPRALALRGHDVTVFTPFYRQTRESLDQQGIKAEDAGTLSLSWGGFHDRATLLRAALPGSSVKMIFVENDELFDRPTLYSNRADGRNDQDYRFTLFCRSVLGAFENRIVRADVLHAHDWHAALLPVYFRFHSATRRVATVYTVHNLNYQGRFGADRFITLGLESTLFTSDTLEFHGDVNIMKGGIVFADQVTTVSPTYAREIQTPEFGAGLDGVLRAMAVRLSGILNGIDLEEWDPNRDPIIAANYRAADLAGKDQCNEDLRRIAGLDPKDGPIIGAVSRLVDQKGFDLFVPIVPSLLQFGAQIVILGSGEPVLEAALREIQNRHPTDVRVFLKFDPDLAHKIIAGSDLMVMPSRYEPCGLNQMYALRYATLPVVRMTGGLADTVRPYDGTNAGTANGFGFYSTDSRELQQALLMARLAFRDRKFWHQLQLNGMNDDFSWDHSARQYEQVYEKATAALGA